LDLSFLESTGAQGTKIVSPVDNILEMTVDGIHGWVKEPGHPEFSLDSACLEFLIDHTFSHNCFKIKK
jgi:hypothetical protein